MAGPIQFPRLSPSQKRAVQAAEMRLKEMAGAAEAAAGRLKDRALHVMDRGKPPEPAVPLEPEEAPEPIHDTGPSRVDREAAAIAWLILTDGDVEKARFPITPGENRIGRADDCEIRLDSDDEVSRRHALIRSKDTELHLCDLASRNGTYLNGARIDRARVLRTGDVISLGGTLLLLRKVRKSPRPAPNERS